MGTLRIIALATGEPTRIDGHYVVEYDPSRPHPDPNSDLTCHLITSPAYDDALKASPAKLWQLYMQSDQREIYRQDGQPNRPLTAYTVEFRN